MGTSLEKRRTNMEGGRWNGSEKAVLLQYSLFSIPYSFLVLVFPFFLLPSKSLYTIPCIPAD
jgi:hypothetical protein